jgi:hypothetical protein
MTPFQYLYSKYHHHKYDNQHAIFTVTLSTYYKETYPHPTFKFKQMWDNHFINKIRNRLPAKAKLDHDYAVELSSPNESTGDKNRYYHYHGLIVLEQQYAHRIWKDGSLRNNIYGALNSFKRNDSHYRPFTINSFLIEPLGNVGDWVGYITKYPLTFYSFT